MRQQWDILQQRFGFLLLLKASQTGLMAAAVHSSQLQVSPPSKLMPQAVSNTWDGQPLPINKSIPIIRGVKVIWFAPELLLFLLRLQVLILTFP